MSKEDLFKNKPRTTQFIVKWRHHSNVIFNNTSTNKPVIAPIGTINKTQISFFKEKNLSLYFK